MESLETCVLITQSGKDNAGYFCSKSLCRITKISFVVLLKEFFFFNLHVHLSHLCCGLVSTLLGMGGAILTH